MSFKNIRPFIQTTGALDLKLLCGAEEILNQIVIICMSRIVYIDIYVRVIHNIHEMSPILQQTRSLTARLRKPLVMIASTLIQIRQKYELEFSVQ